MILTELTSISIFKIYKIALNQQDDNSGIQAMKIEMLTSLKQRFKNVEDEKSDLLLISTARKFVADRCTSVEGEDNEPQRKDRKLPVLK